MILHRFEELLFNHCGEISAIVIEISINVINMDTKTTFSYPKYNMIIKMPLKHYPTLHFIAIIEN